MSNEVVQRRCRRSPTGIEDCQGFTGGTGATGAEAGVTGGTINFTEEGEELTPEAGSFISIPGPWLPGFLSDFEATSDALVYIGTDVKAFVLTGILTVELGASDIFRLSYRVNFASQDGIILGSESGLTGNILNVPISDIVVLSPNDAVSLLGTTAAGSPFTPQSGQLTLSALGV